jgi:hypothetical protein
MAHSTEHDSKASTGVRLYMTGPNLLSHVCKPPREMLVSDGMFAGHLRFTRSEGSAGKKQEGQEKTLWVRERSLPIAKPPPRLSCLP